MEKVDFKKRDKALYQPGRNPEFADVPEMVFLAVDGKGDPNTSADYKNAVGALYALSYTIKMSKKSDSCPPGYFDYVVPPLEGLWWQEGTAGIDYSRKDLFQWVSMIRLPDFVTEADFEWARREAEQKKKQDFSRAEFLTWEEGLCVQCMHIGPYDEEPATLEVIHRFMEENGLMPDFSETRRHHEIYLSDARRCSPEKLKTVIRVPVKNTGTLVFPQE